VSGLLTYANYRISGLNPGGYRAVNLLVHWAAALAAGAVIWAMARAVRRGQMLAVSELTARGHAGEAAPGLPGTLGENLSLETPPATAGTNSEPPKQNVGTSVLEYPRTLAVITSFLWAVHPVQATAVIYINQRQETLMTLFFLVSCLSMLMAGERPKGESRWWRLLSFLAALASLFSKENAAGLVVVLAGIDRLFVSGSWRMIWREHRWFWCGFGGVWLLALGWIATGSRLEEWDALPVLGSPWAYFKTECRVVFHYFQLLVWPDPLVFAPVPRIAERWQDWLPYGLALAAGFGAMAMAAMKPGRAWMWLPWLTILLVLGPTSSFIPVPLEPDFDYRMHLPSVAAIGLAVAAAGQGILSVVRVLGKYLRNMPAASVASSTQEACSPVPEEKAGQPRDWSRLAFRIISGALALVLMAFSLTTRSRSADFAIPESIWLDTVRKEPANIKAWLNLAHILHVQKKDDGARQAVAAILAVNNQLQLPWVEAECHKLNAMLAASQKNWPAAADEYRQALSFMAGRTDLAAGLAEVLLQQKKPQDALAVLDTLPPAKLRQDPVAIIRRSMALLALGRREEALQCAVPAEQSTLLSPDFSDILGEWRAQRSLPAAP
jgi:hypothetical protein